MANTYLTSILKNNRYFIQYQKYLQTQFIHQKSQYEK